MQLTYCLFCDEICNCDLKTFVDLTSMIEESLSQKGRFSSANTPQATYATQAMVRTGY
jgi:hypothetical protein